jgi:hypothetical protein
MSRELEIDFAVKMRYELKRAERYRTFLSLVIFNLGPIVDLAGPVSRDEARRDRFVREIQKVIRSTIREIDFVSNSGRLKVGLLLPETSRQGAEAATRRITDMITEFCGNYLARPDDYLVPVEIASFPDASGTRSIASYMEDFS